MSRRRGPKLASELYPYPALAFQWSQESLAGRPIPEPAGKTFPLLSYTWIWHDVPSVLSDSVSLHVGTIYSVAFDGIGAGQLLLLGIEPEPKGPDAEQHYLWDWHITAIRRPSGWNKLWCVIDAAFRGITNRSDGNGPYLTSDFYAILKTPLPNPPF